METQTKVLIGVGVGVVVLVSGYFVWASITANKQKELGSQAPLTGVGSSTTPVGTGTVLSNVLGEVKTAVAGGTIAAGTTISPAQVAQNKATLDARPDLKAQYLADLKKAPNTGNPKDSLAYAETIKTKYRALGLTM